MDIIGGIFVTILFLLYFLLWKVKKINQVRKWGINPEVIDKSQSNLQKYVSLLFKLLTCYVLIIIVVHVLGFHIGSFFRKIDSLNTIVFDCIGFGIGLLGLSFCLYAQVKMGKSWRVGIDEENKTELVTDGLYKFIRNPTYLGLFILNIGVWLIWPSNSVFLLNVLFFLILEVQVRCEEDYLTKIFGEEYLNYKKRTKRYIPFLY